jgi:hypothetical protein
MSWFNSSSKGRVAVLFCLIVLVVGGGIIAYSMFFAHRATFLKSSYSGTLTMGRCPNGCFSEPMDLLISAQSQGVSISGEVNFHPPPGGINTCSFTGMVLAKQHLAFQCYFEYIANPDNFTGFIYPDGHLAGTVTMKNGIGAGSWNVS